MNKVDKVFYWFMGLTLLFLFLFSFFYFMNDPSIYCTKLEGNNLDETDEGTKCFVTKEGREIWINESFAKYNTSLRDNTETYLNVRVTE